MIRILPLFLALLFAVVPRLHGQNNPDTTARTFRIVAVVGTFADLKFDDAGATRQPRIGRFPSSTLPIPASNQLVLYREIPAPADAPPGTPATIKEPAARVTFPADLRRALVFIAPANGKGFAAHVVDDNPDLSPSDTIRVLNFCRNPAAIRLNQDSRQLAPGENTVVPVPDGGALVQLGVQAGTAWEFAFRRELKFRHGFRHHMFIFEYMNDPDVEDPVSPPPPAIVRLFHDAAPKK